MAIFTSFPGLGELPAARLLAEIGDDATRFADARGLKAYAGAAPVTRARTKVNPQRRHRADRPLAGSVNLRTGKPSLRNGYAAATINHRLAVLSGFYEHARHLGQGPTIDPIPENGRRSTQRRSPLEPRRPGPRGMYRQKQEQYIPRGIPDEHFEELFAELRSDRDRVIVSLLVSSGARAAELLSMTGQDVNWGDQRVRLISKGTREATWVAVSGDALSQHGPCG